MKTYVGLLDCNNFFVSCERLFRPDLAGKPVVVLSSNDGCVVARSQEVKALGVPMGVPHFKVKDIFKQHGVVLFSSNITLYRDISTRVMRVLREFAPDAIVYSIDEAFFTFQATDDDAAGEYLCTIKQAVELQIGVPVSLGAGQNKTIAKYAAEKEKRATGICVLAGTAWQTERPHIPIGDIWGVGGKSAQKLRELGIETVADLCAAAPDRISRIFGVFGTRLRAALLEQVHAGIERETDVQKSFMSTRSFRGNITDLSYLEDALAYHVGNVAAELRAAELTTQVLRVMLLTSRHSDWVLKSGSKEVFLAEPTDDTTTLLKNATICLRQLFQPAVPYKKIGIVASGIVPKAALCHTLFAAETDRDREPLMQTLDAINHRFGSGAVSIGRTHKDDIWGTSRDYLSPAYTTRWSDIPTVQ